MNEWRKSQILAQEQLAERLLYFLKGNRWAVAFCMDLTFIAHLWDDLFDNDRQRTPCEINAAFIASLVGIPSNPFYLEHILDLRPLMRNAILQWQDANVLEKSDQLHDKHLAFGLRASFLQIFNYCAYLTGGSDWVNQVGVEMRELYREPLEDFLQEMEKDNA